MKIDVDLCELEPGNHISRKIVRTISTTIYEIPDADCQEIRPDWGVYHPVTTFPAIERQLKARGAFPIIPGIGQSLTYRFGIVKE